MVNRRIEMRLLTFWYEPSLKNRPQLPVVRKEDRTATEDIESMIKETLNLQRIKVTFI